jgi:catalase
MNRPWSLFALVFTWFTFSNPVFCSPSGDDDPNPNLSTDLQIIKTNAQQMVEANFKKLGKPANRDFHSRGVCLKGTFTTIPGNKPADADVPFFAKATTYPMIARFSNGFPGRDSEDNGVLGSVFGMGIKIIGVAGKKFDIQSQGSTKPVNSNQDWNLATGPTFPIPTPEIYRENRQLSQEAFGFKHPIIAARVLAGLIHLHSFLTISYHSQAALHFGEHHVAKFAAFPCHGLEKTISAHEASKLTKHYTTDDLIESSKTESSCFEFHAQIRPSDENLKPNQKEWAILYPKDDPTKLWSPSVIPYVKLATINFRPYPNVDKFRDTCEMDLSFNPGNTLQDLRPIETDRLMRARYLAAYEGSVSKRTSLNKIHQSEPVSVPDNTADLEKWLSE